MTLDKIVIQKIIAKLMAGEDYRVEILALINAGFLQYVIDFFGKVATAKLKQETIDDDWYKREFLGTHNETDDIIIHAGLNKKTIANSYKSAARQVVLEVAPKHYDELFDAIRSLVAQSNDIDVNLAIKFQGVSVDLNISESLIVINTLAVKRAQIRGGAWSTVGKQVEGYLMRVLCAIYSVPEEHYVLKGVSDEGREVDFYLIDKHQKQYLCEVKLMGKGNPESADAVIARDSDIFIADTLSDSTKEQLRKRQVRWVELHTPQGYTRFYDILQELQIPSQPLQEDIATFLPKVLTQVFQ
jgi:hypothetical protein